MGLVRGLGILAVALCIEVLRQRLPSLLSAEDASNPLSSSSSSSSSSSAGVSHGSGRGSSGNAFKTLPPTHPTAVRTSALPESDIRRYTPSMCTYAARKRADKVQELLEHTYRVHGVNYGGWHVGCSRYGGLAAYAGHAGRGADGQRGKGASPPGPPSSLSPSTPDDGFLGVRAGERAICVPRHYAITPLGDADWPSTGEKVGEGGGKTGADDPRPSVAAGEESIDDRPAYLRSTPSSLSRMLESRRFSRPNLALAARFLAAVLDPHRSPTGVWRPYAESMERASESRLPGLHPRSVRPLVIDTLMGAIPMKGKVHGRSGGNGDGDPIERHPAAAFMDSFYRVRDAESREVLRAAMGLLGSGKGGGSGSDRDDHDSSFNNNDDQNAAGDRFGDEHAGYGESGTTLDGHAIPAGTEGKLDLAQWAIAMADSRTFHLGNGVAAMVPVLDLVNHATGRDANVVLDLRDTNSICVTATRDIPFGEEIAWSYFKATPGDDRSRLFRDQGTAALDALLPAVSHDALTPGITIDRRIYTPPRPLTHADALYAWVTYGITGGPMSSSPSKSSSLAGGKGSGDIGIVALPNRLLSLSRRINEAETGIRHDYNNNDHDPEGGAAAEFRALSESRDASVAALEAIGIRGVSNRPWVPVRITTGRSAISEAFAVGVATSGMSTSPEKIIAAVRCALEWPDICETRDVPPDVAQRAITDALDAIEHRISAIANASLVCPEDRAYSERNRRATREECDSRHAALGRVARDPVAVQDARQLLSIEISVLRDALETVPTVNEEAG